MADISIEKYAGPPKNYMSYPLLERYASFPANWPGNLENVCLIKLIKGLTVATIQFKVYNPESGLTLVHSIQN